MKHYLTNLQRSPERLWAWIGFQQAKKFDFQNLTLFYGFDGNEYKDVHHVHDYAIAFTGIPLPRPAQNSDNAHLKNRYCLRLSRDILLHQIAESNEQGWHVFWEDDYVLRYEYEQFIKCFDAVESDVQTDIQVLGLDCGLFGSENPETKAEAIKRWQTRFERRHPTLELIKGHPGAGFSHCFALTAEGAQRLLEIGTASPVNTYEYVIFKYLKDTETKGVWSTISRQSIKIADFIKSDVKNTGFRIPAKIMRVQ